jgi:DNA-binding response OmpR family regulator
MDRAWSVLRLVCVNGALRILAVDDNPEILRSMPFIFSSPQYEVTTASDGDDALAKLDATPNSYDVIIVDEKMPRLRGVELVERIRQRGIKSKVIVLSAHLSPPIRDAYGRVGVQVVMDKPFDVEELRSVVEATSEVF